jgi:hypothetical protein
MSSSSSSRTTFVLILTHGTQNVGDPPCKVYSFIEVLIDPYITDEEYRLELDQTPRTNVSIYPWAAVSDMVGHAAQFLNRDKYYLVKFGGGYDITETMFGYYNAGTGEIRRFPDQEIADKIVKTFFFENTILRIY